MGISSPKKHKSATKIPSIEILTDLITKQSHQV